MSEIKVIFKNMSWLLVSQIIASICGFVWTILTARYLGVSDYGILGFAISLTGILAITQDYGISIHIIRHISTDYSSAPKYLGNAIPLKTLFCLGSLIITLIILILMKSSELTITITLLFTIEMIFKTFIGIFQGTFQAFEEGKYQGIGNAALNIILLIFIIISIYGNLGLFGITFSYLIANLIVLIYTYYVLQKHITKPKFEFDKEFCKKITLAAIPFAVGSIFYTIYYSIDVVMLNALVGDYATGIYNATYKLISVLTLFYGVYTAVIFPVMSRMFKNDEKALVLILEKSIKYLSLVIVPLAISIMFYSTDIIQLFYGHEYDAASSALSILIWTTCILYINGVCNNSLLASHKEITTTKIYMIAATFNVILNLILIPHYSYNGAAFATVMSDLLILILFAYVLYKLGHIPNKKLYLDIMKIVVGSAVLWIALYFLHLNMWVALPVGILIYFATIYIFKVLDDDDKYVIKEILGKN